ncbi:hypothetical protein A3748_03335 [Erythrobacter sp. HI0077]|nr:hypothetical protein A3745_11265 [Erythrobacter sp. HI0074]KZZ06896.1 hypothetical protein A3748_03335 [Erythrobacter sp. HI0077]
MSIHLFSGSILARAVCPSSSPLKMSALTDLDVQGSMWKTLLQDCAALPTSSGFLPISLSD